jgi:hypothetical protein
MASPSEPVSTFDAERMVPATAAGVQHARPIAVEEARTSRAIAHPN